MLAKVQERLMSVRSLSDGFYKEAQSDRPDFR